MCWRVSKFPHRTKKSEICFPISRTEILPHIFVIISIIHRCFLTFVCFEHRDISKIRILVPGAGLGRLAYELAYRGYYCEGNECSLFMLVASNFVLNKCIVDNQYTGYPWVHQFVNNLSRKDQVRKNTPSIFMSITNCNWMLILQVMPVTFPDVSPTKAKPKGGFNMVAGDFLQVNFTSKRRQTTNMCRKITCMQTSCHARTWQGGEKNNSCLSVCRCLLIRYIYIQYTSHLYLHTLCTESWQNE